MTFSCYNNRKSMYNTFNERAIQILGIRKNVIKEFKVINNSENRIIEIDYYIYILYQLLYIAARIN